jgi:hypothetical protein
VAFLDLESEAGVLTGNGRGHFVELFEWIVRDLQIKKRKIQAVRNNDAVIG